jgi:hypothetical protein
MKVEILMRIAWNSTNVLLNLFQEITDKFKYLKKPLQLPPTSLASSMPQPQPKQVSPITSPSNHEANKS